MPSNRLTVQEAFVIVGGHCGLDATSMKTVKSFRGIDGKICTLARTSPDYQRHVIGRLLSRDRNPFRLIATTLDVYDTVNFNEVLSRLNRANGHLAKKATTWGKQMSVGTSPQGLSGTMLTFDLILEQTDRLLKLLEKLNTVGEGRSYATGKVDRVERLLTPRGDAPAAPASLGLIAKNVRNVSKLRPEHLPTVQQKQRAIDLTRSSWQSAATMLKLAKARFGRAHDQCRVRPRSQPQHRIITHEKPDGDAIASAWLAERFLFREPVEVLFVKRTRVWGAWRSGDCLVDVGNTYDPEKLFFDHKPPAFEDRTFSCAAKLVWNHLLASGVDVKHIQKLIFAVHAVDAPRYVPKYFKEHQKSVTRGFHAAIKRTRLRTDDDAGLYREMRRWLDRNWLLPS